MSTSLLTSRFVRATFFVDAVQVTEQNFHMVAEWCGGVIQVADKHQRKYILVPVKTPQSDRHKMAFPGDWVVKSETGFRSYKTSSFKKTFSPEKTAGEDILHKVFGALLEAGLYGELARHAIREMEQAGIVFGEDPSMVDEKAVVPDHICTCDEYIKGTPIHTDDTYGMGTPIYTDDNYGQVLDLAEEAQAIRDGHAITFKKPETSDNSGQI